MIMEVMKTAKEFRSTIEVVVAIVGCMVYLNVWWSELVVSKTEYQMGINEIRLGQVASDLRYYQRQGLDTLNDKDRHEYETLVKAEEKLLAMRDCMLGLSNDC
jgi:hypothetical protein